MAERNKKVVAARKDRADGKRLSVSLPQDVYQAVEARAASNDVSLAWVVRKALMDYLASGTARRRAKL